MSEIHITVPVVDKPGAHAALALMKRGGEFPTPNGEMPDEVARMVARQWCQHQPVLTALAGGEPVNRDQLSEAVAEVGRKYRWPTELEYLATWVLNHD